MHRTKSLAFLVALAAFLTNPAAQSAMVNPLGDLHESDASYDFRVDAQDMLANSERATVTLNCVDVTSQVTTRFLVRSAVDTDNDGVFESYEASLRVTFGSLEIKHDDVVAAYVTVMGKGGVGTATGNLSMRTIGHVDLLAAPGVHRTSAAPTVVAHFQLNKIDAGTTYTTAFYHNGVDVTGFVRITDTLYSVWAEDESTGYFDAVRELTIDIEGLTLGHEDVLLVKTTAIIPSIGTFEGNAEWEVKGKLPCGESPTLELRAR